jgi:hypothetical protein
MDEREAILTELLERSTSEIGFFTSGEPVW